MTIKFKAYTALLLSVLFTNLAGYLLHHQGYPAYIFFAGFRFHLIVLLPMLFCFLSGCTSWDAAGLSFSGKSPRFSALILLLVPALSAAALYLSGLAKPANPDYLIEFGASSVIDYPVYLFWNLPQLLLLYTVIFSFSRHIPALVVAAAILLLLLYEFMQPLPPQQLAGTAVAVSLLFILGMTAALRQHSPWMFVFIVFTGIWGYVLVWGSSSETVIQLFFARQYNSWEGLLAPQKKLTAWLLPGYAAGGFLLMLPWVLRRKQV